MSKMAHTPGPWEASFTDCLGGPASYCRIRPVSGEMFGQFTSLEIATMHLMDEAEQQANARLIAAAPDLLVALEQLVSDYERGIHVEFGGSPWLKEKLEELDYARAAIAKATGASDG